MTKTTPTVQERLLAQLDLAEERLERFSERLELASERSQARFSERLDRVTARSRDLADQIRRSSVVSVGTETAIDDLDAAVDTLEADLDATAEAETDAYRSAVDRQLRIWRARTEHLRLQTSLGTMEIREDFEELGSRLSKARRGALVELKHAARDTRNVVVDVRDDLEDVLTDVRHAVERVADSLTHETSG